MPSTRSFFSPNREYKMNGEETSRANSAASFLPVKIILDAALLLSDDLMETIEDISAADYSVDGGAADLARSLTRENPPKVYSSRGERSEDMARYMAEMDRLGGLLYDTPTL